MTSCRNLITLAAILAAYLAGTMAPHASADATHEIVSELRGIRGELAAIRRRLEGGAR